MCIIDIVQRRDWEALGLSLTFSPFLLGLSYPIIFHSAPLKTAMMHNPYAFIFKLIIMFVLKECDCRATNGKKNCSFAINFIALNQSMVGKGTFT